MRPIISFREESDLITYGAMSTGKLTTFRRRLLLPSPGFKNQVATCFFVAWKNLSILYAVVYYYKEIVNE